MIKKRSTLLIVLAPILIFLFQYLTYNTVSLELSFLFQPVVFLTAFYITLTKKNLGRYVVTASIVCFFSMITFYVFNNISRANTFGSLSFGIMMFYLVAKLPELLKDGSLQKL